MHYFIDGYNLLFRQLHSHENLRHERDRLIQALVKQLEYNPLEVTIVFDSQYQPDEGSRGHYKNLEIYFTALHETADEFIIKQLKNSTTPTQETVVTSDQKLAWHCRRLLAKTIEIKDFIRLLNNRYQNKRRYQENSFENPPQKNSKKEPIPSPSILNKPLRPLIPLPVPTVKKRTTEQNTDPLSDKNNAIEACFDNYLEIFEKSLAADPTPPRQSKQKNKIFKTSPQKTEIYIESEMQRWLRLFKEHA